MSIVWENRVSIKRLLRTLVVCLPLMIGSLSGLPMKPEEAEELMHCMNQPKITITIPGESANGVMILWRTRQAEKPDHCTIKDPITRLRPKVLSGHYR